MVVFVVALMVGRAPGIYLRYQRLAQRQHSELIPGHVQGVGQGLPPTCKWWSAVDLSCRKRCQTKPSQTGRPPAEGHVASKSIEEIEKEAKANGGWLNTQQDRDRGNEQQCTALVKQATGLGQASEWRAGDKIKGPDDPPLKPGTAIATFNDKGTYGADKGRHAAIFVGYKEENGQKGMEVLEQSKDLEVKRKFIPFSSSGKFIYQAGNYSVIKK